MVTKTTQEKGGLLKVVEFTINKIREAVERDDFEITLTSSFTKVKTFDIDIYVSWSFLQAIYGPIEIRFDADYGHAKTKIGVFYYRRDNGAIDVEYVDARELDDTCAKLHELIIEKVKEVLRKTLKELS